MQPLVSVVIPCHNAGETLRFSLESILEQDYSNLEIIVVNDNSTDSSCAIANHIAMADKRVRLVNNDRGRGIPSTRNLGIKEAKGDFIAWLDADDVAMPCRIGKQVDFLLNNRNIDVVGSFALIVETHEPDNEWKINPLVSRYTDHSHICCDALFRLPVLTPTSMIRAKKIKSINRPYNEEVLVCSDYDLLVRMMDVWHFANIPEPLVRIRVSKNANTTQRHRSCAKQTDTLIQSHLLKFMGLMQANDNYSLHRSLCLNIEDSEQNPDATKIEINETHRMWLAKLASHNAQSRFLTSSHCKIA